MENWFYGQENIQHGPVSETEIRNLLSTGEIKKSTMVWRNGMTDWLPVMDIPEFQAPSQTAIEQSQYTETAAPTDNLAIISMVLGITGIIASCLHIGILFGIPAVIFGHLSIKKINRSAIAIGGKGMAIAGLITGYLAIITSLCMIGIVIFFYSIAISNISTP